jgi:hypothetical protein
MELFSCPECRYENPKGTVSCKRCLLIFEKYEKKNLKLVNQVASSKVMEDMWTEVISDYENNEKHEKFISQALKEKKLPYASQQYKKMIDTNGSDEIASKMIAKIINVATLTYVPPFRKEPPKSTRWLTTSILLFIVTGVVAAAVFIYLRKV